MTAPAEHRQSRFLVTEDEAGLRLEQVIHRRYPELTRRILRELFDEGRVRRDARVARKGERVASGTSVCIELPRDDRAHPNPDLELDVVFESDSCVVINKSPGVACAVRRGDELNTISNALVARYPAMAQFGHPREAGLVHRLDNDTSGLLVAAKTHAAFDELCSALKGGSIEKRYLALVESVSQPEGVIESELCSDPGHRRRVLVRALTHRAATDEPAPPAVAARVSRYRVVERHAGCVLLEVRVATAYRHQIRAHLSAIGSPIVGDLLYKGSRRHWRHALHASYLAYAGGASTPAFALSAPLPEDLMGLLR